MTARYWFARNIRVNYRGHDRYRKGAMPLSWEGWAVIAGFVVAMIAGALLMALVGFYGNHLALGIALYVILAIAGGGTFIWAVATKSDPNKSMAEYRAERLKNRG